MIAAALFGLAALGLPTTGKSTVHATSKSAIDETDAPTEVSLSTHESARFKDFAMTQIQEMAAACSTTSFDFSVMSVMKAAKSVCGHGDEALELALETSAGEITVTILEEVVSGNLHLDWIEPYDFMPACVVAEIQAVRAPPD